MASSTKIIEGLPLPTPPQIISDDESTLAAWESINYWYSKVEMQHGNEDRDDAQRNLVLLYVSGHMSLAAKGLYMWLKKFLDTEGKATPAAPKAKAAHRAARVVHKASISVCGFSERHSSTPGYVYSRLVAAVQYTF